MDELKVFERDGIDVVDSRDVAQMIEKNHRDLMRSIHSYIEAMRKSTERNFAPSDFFIENTYKDSTGRSLPCYLLTKKGCDMVANKMTGEKGVLFTAAYVTAFEKMRDTITNGALIAPKDYPSALRALADAEEKRLALQAKNEQQAQMIGELKPKADYTDRILKSKGVVPITAIAKDYGMSGNEMNKLLHSLGVQYRMGDMWLLYRCYHGKGYTHSETFDFKHQDGTQDARMTTKWTQKGRLFLYDLLKEHGVLPVIEREDLDKAQ